MAYFQPMRKHTHHDRGVAFIEATLIISGFLLVLIVGYTILYPKIRNRLIAIDLEQAMDMAGAIAPEPAIYELVEGGGSRVLLPEAIVRSELLQVSNRVASNTYWKVPICSILIQVRTTATACYRNIGGVQTPNIPIDRSVFGSGVFGGGEPFDSSYEVLSGADQNVGCGNLRNLLYNNAGRCLDKFRQLVRIDCSQADQKAWGVVIFPDFPDYYESCAVINARAAQPEDSWIYPKPS